MAGPQIVLLLLGPTRSGKTTFVKRLGARPTDGKLENGSTLECKDYEIKVSGKDFLIIDTPGLDDSPAGNLAVLEKIAVRLRTKGSPEVNAVIYFHRITNTRLTGSARSNIDIFLQICGTVFFGQTAFVTTMWDIISSQEHERFVRLNKELRRDMLARTSNLTLCHELDGPGRALAVLDHFAKSKKLGTNPQRLAFARELEALGSAAPSNVRRTTAGRQVVKDMNRGFCMIL